MVLVGSEGVEMDPGGQSQGNVHALPFEPLEAVGVDMEVQAREDGRVSITLPLQWLEPIHSCLSG